MASKGSQEVSSGSGGNQCYVFSLMRLHSEFSCLSLLHLNAILGADKGAYYHELFLRGKTFLAKRIVRVQTKNEGRRKIDSPETEPNFYNMTPIPNPLGTVRKSQAQNAALRNAGNSEVDRCREKHSASSLPVPTHAPLVGNKISFPSTFESKPPAQASKEDHGGGDSDFLELMKEPLLDI